MSDHPFLSLLTSIKNLSRWASLHGQTAILLLICCEVCNALNGLLLGANLLERWSSGSLGIVIFSLLGCAFFVQAQSGRVAGQSYWVGRRWLFGAFMLNFLLFIGLGGYLASHVQMPTTSQAAWGNKRVTIQSDTLVPPAARRSTNPAYYEERSPVSEQPVTHQTGKRIGFVLLFLLGIVLSTYAAALSCTLLCAGNGVAALLLFLLSTGIFAGSFFLLSRAFGKVVKPWRQMNRLERKRTYVRALFLIGAFYAITLLMGSVFGR